MKSFVFNSDNVEFIVREATRSDVDALVELNRRCYPDLTEKNIVWRKGHLLSHHRNFAQGQLVVETEGRIVGAAASLIVDLGRDPHRSHTFAGITDGGFFHNHTPEGDTLYGADIFVDPQWRRKGIGKALYEGRRRLCRELHLRRIIAGARLYNYCDHASEMTPEEYAARVEAGDLQDQVLSFQLKEGFSFRGVLRNYLKDERSHNCAVFIEWLNPDYKPEVRRASKVRVACVQYQMRKVADFEDFAAQVEYFVETAADYKSDFVVFPEFFTVQLLSHLDVLAPREGIRQLTRFTEPFIELMSELSKRYGFYIVGGSHPVEVDGVLHNVCMIFHPDGSHTKQPKLHITPAERTYWGITGGNSLTVLSTPKARVAVLICYDVEFPEAARYLADEGAEIIFVPYCTDNRQGHLRVRYCAQARAIENQIYIVTAGIIGNLPSVPAMDIHYGQAAVYTPSDFEFARDGIQAQADSNVETLLVTDLDISDLYRSRNMGSVTPRLDRRKDLFDMVAHIKRPDLDGTPDDPPLHLPG